MLKWLHKSSEYALAVAFFRKHGFVGFSDLFSIHEAEALRTATQGVHKDDHSLTITHDSVFQVSALMDLSHDERIWGTASKLIGCPIELYNAKINVKPFTADSDSVVHWHQDWPFHPHSNYDLLSGVVHIDDEEDVRAGPLRVIPGSHTWGPLPHEDESGNFVGRCCPEVNSHFDPSRVIVLQCKPGTTIFHHCLLLHYSGPKRRTGLRRHLIFSLRAQDALQLGGAVWKSTGMQLMPNEVGTRVRFFDGTVVQVRKDFRMSRPVQVT